MAITVPLIRGFALLPTLTWFARNGIPVEEELKRYGLLPDPALNPFRPIPLVPVAALLRAASRRIAPDFPCRVVSEASSLELAVLGKVALGTGTPREAFSRIIPALPFYCSHEQLSMQRGPGGVTVVREFFSHRFDPETRHFLLQYASAIVNRICRMAGAPQPAFARLEIPPHPEFGVEYLRPWYGDAVTASRSRGFAATIEDRVLDHRFPSIGRDRFRGRDLGAAIPLRGDGTLSGSVRSFLLSMFEVDEVPSLKRLVAATGTSERTFQRQLEAEGTSFSTLLEEVRRAETMSRLGRGGMSIGMIASDLGYSDQASLTRAFRRWTGRPPSHYQREGPPSATQG